MNLAKFFFCLSYDFDALFFFGCLFLVSLECVNVCKLSKGDGSGRYDCSVLSCAWKAPRILTGFLASTAHSPQSSSFLSGRNGRRNQFKSVSCLN